MPSPTDLSPSRQIIQLSVRSHLVFTEVGEPEVDETVRQYARVFGENFGALLKERTAATTIRVGDYEGRRTESGDVEVVFFIFYFSLQTALQWHQFYTQLSPIAESWADETWHRQLHGYLVRSENIVRVVGGPFASEARPRDPVLESMAQDNPLRQRARRVAWWAAGAVAFVLGAGALWLAIRPDPNVQRYEEVLRRLEALEATPTLPQEITQTVTVAPAPPVTTVIERDRERGVRRYSSRPE